jgi:glycosyltransferase involved in cell wall biosynthesis
VHEQTASAYASTAKKLLEDRSLRQRMGDRARQYAIEHYQWGKALRELLDNYERAAIDNEEQAGIQENEKERSDASE